MAAQSNCGCVTGMGGVMFRCPAHVTGEMGRRFNDLTGERVSFTNEGTGETMQGFVRTDARVRSGRMFRLVCLDSNPGRVVVETDTGVFGVHVNDLQFQTERSQ